MQSVDAEDMLWLIQLECERCGVAYRDSTAVLEQTTFYSRCPSCGEAASYSSADFSPDAECCQSVQRDD